jgi:oligopeptide transport system ATP-binding protein
MSPLAPVLAVEGLTKTFTRRTGLPGFRRTTSVAAVRDVSFTVAKGETLGLVGESGSGKSTTARLLLRLIDPTAGMVRLNGNDLASLSAHDLRQRRGGMQMVFQDPFASLNPRLSVGYQVAEPLIVHGIAGRAETRDRVAALLERVGLNPAHAGSYPHQFSGGQRQRIAIARALAVAPDLIVADEAVSALDVSVRAQILNLLADIRREQQLSMVFISHDLGVVRHVVDRVAVMYRGRIVESGPGKAVFETPRHPYTRELLEAMPVTRPGGRQRPAEALPRTTEAPAGEGCSFSSRVPARHRALPARGAAARPGRSRPSQRLLPGPRRDAVRPRGVPGAGCRARAAAPPAGSLSRREGRLMGLLGRIGSIVVTLFLLSVVVFSLQLLLPGDPATVLGRGGPLARDHRLDPRALRPRPAAPGPIRALARQCRAGRPRHFDALQPAGRRPRPVEAAGDLPARHHGAHHRHPARGHRRDLRGRLPGDGRRPDAHRVFR